MVILSAVQASNNAIASHLPASLVSVFVGGTTGIGAATAKALAKHSTSPKIYIIGRSEASAENVIAECRTLNPDGAYEFLKADVSTMKSVDRVCEELKKREKRVDILVLSPMTPDFSGTKTSDGLPIIMALGHYARMRFAYNLLPLLAPSPLARVISVAGGGKEGVLDTDDLAAYKTPRTKLRAHCASLISLGLEGLAANTDQGKNVTFIQTYPGTVVTPLFDNIPGLLGVAFRWYLWLMGWLICVPLAECAERDLWLCTSGAFPTKARKTGVSLDEGLVSVAKGTDGEVGSGVYSLGWDGDCAAQREMDVLRRYREDGVVEKVWEDLRETWHRTTK